MKLALIVLDVQKDFVEDKGLVPQLETFLFKVEELLSGARLLGIPVIHVHYVTEPDGRGYMPHHRKQEQPRCLRGSKGAEAHSSARPRDGEAVFAKHSYSAFSISEFEGYLDRRGINSLVICGLFSHVCVRQTAWDAIERGLSVQIAGEAIASNDPLHAGVTKDYLAGKGVEYVDTGRLLQKLSERNPRIHESKLKADSHPVACIGGNLIKRTNQLVVEVRNPTRWEQVLGRVPECDSNTVACAVSEAHKAQTDWKSRSLEERLSLVRKWGNTIETRIDRLLPLMIEEVGKPVSACRMEMDLLRRSLEVMAEIFTKEALERVCLDTPSQVALARRCPRGVVGIITPWNNPAFLPACKIAAAIALGNSVVWKPSIPCPRTSLELMDSLLETGFPAGVVNLVFGGASTARHIIRHPQVSAITLTGSVDTGRQVAAACGYLLKPLQAELGGNNAVIITPDCDLKKVASLIAPSAFAYAGQACTATRRVVVLESVKEAFIDSLFCSAGSLILGDPENEATVVGPVISRSHQGKIEHLLNRARKKARMLEVELPPDLPGTGCWMPPRIVDGLDASDPLVQTETFAPVLVVQTAADIREAIRLCNQVPNGLIGSIFSEDDQVLQEFQRNVETGIIQLNRPSRSLLMEAPFGGWKDSGLGPPEHGIWDLDFYTRWQAVYKNRGH